MINYIKKHYKSILSYGAILFAIVALSITVYGNISSKDGALIGVATPDAIWTVVNKFDGYQTKADPTKVTNGANPQGQNTTANEGDRISVRQLGYELFPNGTATTTANPIKSLHTFRKRSGENIMMRSQSTLIEFYDESQDAWETIKTGLTSGEVFGYADYNINTDLVSYVYFGNQSDNGMYWSGVHSNLATAVTVGDGTIVIDDISGFLTSGFIILCGAEEQYSSINTSTNTFTLTAPSTTACAIDRSVAQTVLEHNLRPKGNIYLAANNRLFIAGIASTTQAVYFSEYGDATNFVNASLVLDSTDTSPGIFNLGVGGGAVTGMVLDENSIYIFKRSTIWKATLTDTIYTLTDLKPFDGKGQTVGAVGQKSIFTGDNGVYFITPDNQLMSLQRIESVDYPQIIPISDIIKPTVDQADFGSASGVVFRDKAYFSFKAIPGSPFNDTILVWNIKEKFWDSPIVGWNVDDWTVYDDGVSEELYFGNAVTTNVYKINSAPLDDIFSVAANWRSKQFNFEIPYAQKEIVDMFVEGYIAENTTLEINLLLDEDGFTQTFSTELKGTDSEYIYDSSEFNTLGLTAFGTKRFGSQEDLSGLKKFRVYLGKDFRATPFYNLQVEFASDGENQNWEILSFGLKARPYSTPEKRTLYKAFK